MKDKFTDEQIRGFFSGDYDHLTCKEFRELTRSEPEFSEGEVLIDKYQPWQCITVNLDDCMKYLNYRSLTLTEHGKHVRDLRDAVASVSGPTYEDNGRSRVLDRALARFDAAVKDE